MTIKRIHVQKYLIFSVKTEYKRVDIIDNPCYKSKSPINPTRTNSYSLWPLVNPPKHVQP